MAGKRSITVEIAGKEYQIRGEADEKQLQRAANLFNETIAMVRDRTGTVDSLNVTVLAGLNLASRLLSGREGEEMVDSDRIRVLVELIESIDEVGSSPQN